MDNARVTYKNPPLCDHFAELVSDLDRNDDAAWREAYGRNRAFYERECRRCYRAARSADQSQPPVAAKRRRKWRKT